MSRSTPTRSRWLTTFAWILVPLLIGVLLALLIPQPVIGVIRLDREIDSISAANVLRQIEYARHNAAVRAVVLVLDSPGGTVVDSESIYLELARLRAQKPVISVIEGMAASGAYYAAVGTDYIFGKPSSQVGNVGVISSLPSSPELFEELIWSGPYKFWGSSRDGTMRSMEMIKRQFYRAVELGRADALQVGPDVVLRGELWEGTAALRYGLIDALGTQSEAVEYAARLARVSNVATRDLSASVELLSYPTAEGQFGASASPVVQREPGIYLLYVAPAEGRLP